MKVRRLCRNVLKCKSGICSPFAFLTTIIAISVILIYFLQAKPAFQRIKNGKLTFMTSDTVNKIFARNHRGFSNGTSHSRGDDSRDIVGMKAMETELSQENGHTSKVKRITADEFRQGHKTGNTLIDHYGQDDSHSAGGFGRGVVLTNHDNQQVARDMSKYRVNVAVSDMIPLNRRVPDSRIEGCNKLRYLENLPTASVIIPFYNEWPSLLLRTVYSVINRTPRKLLKEIILIDDASTLDTLQQSLQDYIDENFPEGLVRLERRPERKGLIKARMHGSRVSTGDVLVFFDSHMEVNINWLAPLLTEIAKDRKTVAMSTLDYVQADTFEYRFNVNYLTRYGWDWRLIFFETFFREDQIRPRTTSPRPGPTMVGAAFAMDKQYFFELGGYDEGMVVWGGENLEMSWRVWLCGGRLMHVPCSRIGHVARTQPYSFPGGRLTVEHFNYKRAIAVWMGNYTRFVYHTFPDMKTLDVGDLSSRLALKAKLKCKDFSWYLRNVWPELNVPDENVTHWGSLSNEATGDCLDNLNYLFQAENTLYLQRCDNRVANQAFSLTTEGLLRTSLQCVVSHQPVNGGAAKLEDCIIGTRDRWKYTKEGLLIHETSELCLDVGASGGPVLMHCKPTKRSQSWKFQPFNFN